MTFDYRYECLITICSFVVIAIAAPVGLCNKCHYIRQVEIICMCM